ncbi:MAG: TRCF domain-containing protein, partial [Acidimicrobiia bacterium]
IRGAGSILGEVQSGQIAAVGVDLYAELVAEAVSELRGAPPPRPPLPEIRIDLNVDAHLPDGYVVEQAARLEAYRRLAAAAGQAEVDEVVAEWRDRYGELPLAAENLAAVARLRVEALRVGISEIVQLRNEVRLGPVSLAASQEVRLERLAPAAVLRPSEGLMFLPVPEGDVAAGLLAFMGEMWPSRSQVVHRA